MQLWHRQWGARVSLQEKNALGAWKGSAAREAQEAFQLDLFVQQRTMNSFFFSSPSLEARSGGGFGEFLICSSRVANSFFCTLCSSHTVVLALISLLAVAERARAGRQHFVNGAEKCGARARADLARDSRTHTARRNNFERTTRKAREGARLKRGLEHLGVHLVASVRHASTAAAAAAAATPTARTTCWDKQSA